MSEGKDTLTGFRSRRGDLLGVHNAKTIKGESLGVLTAIMYLAPHTLSGFNVCAASSPDCRADCLYSSGRGAMRKIQDARIARTLRYFNDRAFFLRQLVDEIAALETLADRHNMRLAVRLNGTSDILWERAHPAMFARFPRVRFYDYTKHAPRRLMRLGAANYHLTFSAEAHTLERAAEWIGAGHNVAAVVSADTHARLLEASGEKNRLRFHDAAAHDVRFLDPALSVGLLLPKGSLRKQTPQTSRMILTEQAARELGFRAHLEAQRRVRGAA